MTQIQTIKTLQMLKQMRERGVSELTGQLSQQKQLCQRYQRNIDALTTLCDETGRQKEPSAALMINQSSYKSHIQRVIDWQKQEFSLADKQAQNIQSDLVKEACREKTVELVLNEQQVDLRLQQDRQQQKITDGMSAQCWLRNQTATR